MTTAIKTVTDMIVAKAKELSSEYGNIAVASEALDSANLAQSGKRRTIMLAMAKLATEQKFKVGDIAAGVKAAVATYATAGISNAMSEKTFQNFAGEVKAAMDPNVCAGYANLCAMADTIFKQEKADTAEVRDTYKRAQLMVNSIASAAAKKNSDVKMPQTEADIRKIAKAKATAAKEDPTKCRNMVLSIKERLQEANRTFPCKPFTDMIALCDQLSDIDTLKEALSNAKNARKLQRGNSRRSNGVTGASDVGTTLDQLNA